MKLNHGQAGQHPVRPQQMQRADRIGALPTERRAAIVRQGLRQDQQTINRVGEAEARRRPERQARIEPAEQSADRRSQDESGPERHTDLAEHRCSTLGRRHIRDIGKGG